MPAIPKPDPGMAASAANAVNPPTGKAIFGAHAVMLRRAGLAVIPAKGKKPIRTGFNVWKHAPGMKTVERWAARNSTANIVYIPGLSRSRHNPTASWSSMPTTPRQSSGPSEPSAPHPP